jgi:hypothetical protein
VSDPPGSLKAGREAYSAYVEERRLRLAAESALERAERERDAMTRELELRDQESLAVEARAQKAEAVVEAAREVAHDYVQKDHIVPFMQVALTAYDDV